MLQERFASIGARLHTIVAPHRGGLPFSLDVRTDRRGELFELQRSDGIEVGFEVVDARPELRHLLLLVREAGGKHKFLCGHDERHWFAAAVPERYSVGRSRSRGVAGVRDALEALKPWAVRLAQGDVKPRDRLRRKTSAYVRQGEWFFVPAPKLVVPPISIVRNEPLSRGNGSQPHRVDECFRTGGTTVYVCDRRPAGVSQVEYERLLDRNPKARNWRWQSMVREAQVYVRGRVRHADHKTIELDGWHRVFMNTENEAPAARNVVFLD